VGIECDELNVVSANGEGIGIDIGVKTLAVCCDGATCESVNKRAKIRKLNKKARRLQRAVSRKYTENKKGERYRKTRNIIKSEKRLLKVNRRLRNIRHDYLHQMTSEIANRKPRFIIMDDLNVDGMMKNRHLSKAVQEQCFRELYRKLAYNSN
jgi:putative transposase